MENGITNPNDLAVGQTIVIVQPKTPYTAQPGDTLESISVQFEVSQLDTLRNNPYLSDKKFISVGEGFWGIYKKTFYRKSWMGIPIEHFIQYLISYIKWHKKMNKNFIWWPESSGI